MKILISIVLLLASIARLSAQNIQYDPLQDKDVKVLEEIVNTVKGEYMWYPGQLSAHLQQKRVKESGERCLNVGYPGKFYAPVFSTAFRKEINEPIETVVEWTSTGNVQLFIDNKEAAFTASSVTLQKGKHTVLLKVQTENNVPSIQVKLNGKITTEGWKTSLDNKSWNVTETSPVFGTGGRMPLDDPETIIEIKPKTILPVRNATIEGDKITVGKNGYVLIDFYHIEMGKVSFTAAGKGKLTVFVGESPEEALNENTKFFEQVAIPLYSLTATATQITLPERAVRYLKIVSDEGCEISSVKFTAKVWPIDFLMSFDCSDERINTIWSASVASLHTSTHGFYLDGIKRDYLPWSMDAVLSTFAGDYLFGDEQVSRNSLSVAMLPLNPTKSDLGIPDYPLHALIGFNHYLQRYGDFNIILSYRDRIEQLLALYETLQDDRGFISANVGVSWGFVPGWSTKLGPDRKGTPAYAQIMLYYNYKIGTDFCKKWGDNKLATHYNEKAESLKKSILKHFWDEKQGLFYNGYTQKAELDKGISHHAQYWGILAGIFPENRYDGLFTTLATLPHYRDNVSYEKGYEFLAYSKAGRVKEMWDFLFDVFGDWLEQGQTRFPENFSYKKSKEEQLVFYNRPYGLSLCHGANGVPGVVAVLHGIGGFSQSASQPNYYTIRPDLMYLKWANIEFPVKEGKISLKLTKDGKNEIEIPSGCKVDFFDKNNKKTTLTKKGIYKL